MGLQVTKSRAEELPTDTHDDISPRDLDEPDEGDLGMHAGDSG